MKDSACQLGGGLSSISLLAPDPDKIQSDPKAKTLSFFCKRRPVRIDAAVIAELIHLGSVADSRNVRVCLHESPAAEHHDMIILEHRGRYYRPHRHNRKGECFHIMRGEMGVFGFADDGEVLDAIRLNPGDIYRIEVGMYHAVMPLSDTVVYHESKPGPFLGESDSIYPSWAPDGSDPAAVRAYVSSLLDRLRP